MGFPGGASGIESTCKAGDTRDMGSIPGSGRFPGEENGNPLQYSCLGNSTDRGAWWAMICGVAESDMTEHTHIPSRGLYYDPLGIFVGVSLLRPWPLSECQCQPDPFSPNPEASSHSQAQSSVCWDITPLLKRDLSLGYATQLPDFYHSKKIFFCSSILLIELK